MKKEYLAVKEWNDDFNGYAIYSLVDQTGKRYIGQAKHLQQRLETHRRELNKVVRGNTEYMSEGIKLIDAVQNGSVFTVEILKKFPPHERTENMLRLWECAFFSYYGGLENTYNSTYPYYPNWGYEGFNIEKNG